MIVKCKHIILIARITNACSTCHATHFGVASYSNMLRKVDTVLLFATNSVFQLATFKFFAWKVEHAVVIRATTRQFNLQCNNGCATS